MADTPLAGTLLRDTRTGDLWLTTDYVAGMGNDALGSARSVGGAIRSCKWAVRCTSGDKTRDVYEDELDHGEYEVLGAVERLRLERVELLKQWEESCIAAADNVANTPSLPQDMLETWYRLGRLFRYWHQKLSSAPFEDVPALLLKVPSFGPFPPEFFNEPTVES